MDEKLEQFFKRRSLASFSFKNRWLIRFADVVFFLAILAISKTLRFEVEGIENYTTNLESGRPPILAVWHEHVFAAAYDFRHRGVIVMASNSVDGEIISRINARLGIGTARGSSSRRGREALIEMIRASRAGVPTALMVDGPRGPRHEVKTGISVLAKRTGNPIVPLSLEHVACWRVRSWDRLRIPKPFTTVLVMYGAPIYVGPNDDIDTATDLVKSALDELEQAGRVWRESKFQ